MKIKSSLRNKTKGDKIVYTIASVIIGLFALSYVLAFLWAIMAGMKTHDEVVMNPFALPETWNWKHYLEVFSVLEVRGVNFFGMVGNSLIRVAIAPVFGILGSMLLAYAVAKYDFPGKNALIIINTIVMTLPIIGTTASTYRLFSALGFIDSPKLLLAGFGHFGGNFLFFLSAFKGVSNTYSEAARIDGAGHFRIMAKIVFPMIAGTTSALWILSVIAVWNDYGTALLFWPNMPTLATGIYLFNQEMVYRARMDILIAATVVSAIPPLILFAIAHKKLLTSVTFGGIKG